MTSRQRPVKKETMPPKARKAETNKVGKRGTNPVWKYSEMTGMMRIAEIKIRISESMTKKRIGL